MRYIVCRDIVEEIMADLAWFSALLIHFCSLPGILRQPQHLAREKETFGYLFCSTEKFALPSVEVSTYLFLLPNAMVVLAPKVEWLQLATAFAAAINLNATTVLAS